MLATLIMFTVFSFFAEQVSFINFMWMSISWHLIFFKENDINS